MKQTPAEHRAAIGHQHIRYGTGALIEFLDSLAKIDPAGMGRLIKARVPCNDALAEHPTVQVGPDKDGSRQVGLLGILNGYAGKFEGGEHDGYGPIAATIEDDGSCSGFRWTHMRPRSNR